MSDLIGNAEDRFSQNEAHFEPIVVSKSSQLFHGVQHRMISVDNFFVLLKLLFFALLLLYET